MIMPRTQFEESEIMPHAIYSAEAEKAVLGCMMAQPHEVIEDVLDHIDLDDFFVPAHREIFKVLAEMFISKQTIEVMSIHQWLVDRKLAEPLGSPGILAELLVGFATHLNVSSYVQIVKKKSLLRNLQSATVEIAKEIHEMPDDVELVLERAEVRIHELAESNQKGSILNAAQCVGQFEEWRGKIQRGEIESRLKTGLSAFDHTNGGLPIPSYVVIAGEQGVGKSALILNIMRFACLEGIPVGGMSMEMTINQIVGRQIADIADINSRRLNGKLHPAEEGMETFAKTQIRKMPFYIDPTPGLMARDIRSLTRRFVRLGCKIVWLDNAQLTRGSTERATRVDQLKEVSRTIQEVQKEHDIVFILLAQITRESKKRGNLQAFDVADCSAIECDARVMLMLEKKLKEGDPEPLSSAVPIIARVVKYSEGETGDFDLTFNKQKQRIG